MTSPFTRSEVSTRPIALLVTGMHRSGTSALARVFSLCGMGLPRTLMRPAESNPDGFWESSPIAEFNEGVLESADTSWDDPLVAQLPLRDRYSAAQTQQAAWLITEEFAADRAFVLKDPRLCVLLPLWRDAAGALNKSAKLVVAVRNPLEVAQSLLARDGFPIAKSMLLWLSYFLAVERDSRDMDRVFVAYDDLLDDWRAAVSRVERKLNVRMPLQTPGAELAIDKFLSADKRRQHASIGALKTRGDVPAWIADAFEWALCACSDEAEPDWRPLERIAAEFTASARTFAPVLAYESARSREAERRRRDSDAAESGLETLLVAVYSATHGLEFAETACTRQRVPLSPSPAAVRIPLPSLEEAADKVRLDLSEMAGACFLHDIVVRDQSNVELWRWKRETEIFNTGEGQIASPAPERNAVLLEFLHRDPHFTLPLSGVPPRAEIELILSQAPAAAIEAVRLANISQPQHRASVEPEFDAAPQRAAPLQCNDAFPAHDPGEEVVRDAQAEVAEDAAFASCQEDAKAESLAEVGGQLASDIDQRMEKRLRGLADDLDQRLSDQQADTAQMERRLIDAFLQFSSASNPASFLAEIRSELEVVRRDAYEGTRRSEGLVAASQQALDEKLSTFATSLSETWRDVALDKTANEIDAKFCQGQATLERIVQELAQRVELITPPDISGILRQIRHGFEAFEERGRRQEALAARRFQSLEERYVELVAGLSRGHNEVDRRFAEANEKFEVGIATLSASMGTLRDEQAQTAAAAERLSETMNELLGEHAKARAAAESLSESLDRVRDDIATRSRAADVDEVRAAVWQLHHVLREGFALGDEASKLLNKSVHDLGERQDVTTALQQRISDLIRERDGALSTAYTWRQQLHDVYTSRSWQVTSPFRAARRAVQFSLGAPIRKVARGIRPRPVNERSASTSNGLDNSEDSKRVVCVQPASENDYVPLSPSQISVPLPARVIAFYLPQFHPIPENDAWWGRGFTEWTNVTLATPQFDGHYQPHLPGELGFYDLRVPEVQERQAELAKQYGIYGFCFYFYWFRGKRLLETPLRQWLANRKIDLPYCICWANENWNRSWDGLDGEILIGQSHSPDDDVAFIGYIAEYLRDSRYIRIDGRPLLLVYRPSLLPDAKETSARWRAWCRENGIGEIYLAYTQSFDCIDPAEYGFDGAVEFPPNISSPPVLSDSIGRTNPEFSGAVYDYRAFPQRSRAPASRSYDFYRGLFPSWDNEPRRRGRGTVFLNSTPALFETWARNLIRQSANAQLPADRRLIFVNAWNEWAEGAHLEPDRRYGYAWLQSVRNALEGVARETIGNKIILVVHDAYLHGAQFLALSLARALRDEMGRLVEIVLLGDGPLSEDFARVGAVHCLRREASQGAEGASLAQELAQQGAKCAICNTAVSGLFMAALARAGIRCVSLVHELPGVIGQYGLSTHIEAIKNFASLTVFPADEVRRAVVGDCTDRTAIRTQGLYKLNGSRTPEQRAAARARLRSHFGLDANAHVVLGVGFGDRRKGIDLFLEAAQRVLVEDSLSVFIWLGEIEMTRREEVYAFIASSPFADRILLPGFQGETDDFYAGADVLALTSREDPFPTVILEALDVAVPVVAFRGAGGFDDLIDRGCGLLAPMENVDAFSRLLLELLFDPSRRAAMGETGLARVRQDYSFRRYAFDICAFADPCVLRVSVVVPNYNYARYLRDRLDSIFHQTAPLYEIIVLDDASTDGSVAILEDELALSRIDHEVIVNAENGGSPCRQWLRGVERARGDIVWIAEADDLCEFEFVAELLTAFRDKEVVMAYCQSQQIGSQGQVLSPNYLDYVADICHERWKRPYVVNGLDEIRSALAVKNTIPNVSACLFRREALLEALREHIEEIASFRVAGDWATYARVLEKGKIAFSPRALNRHRRHERSITLGSFNDRLLREILTMQSAIRARHRVDNGVRTIADNYAQELYVQFELHTDDAPHVRTNPTFADLVVRPPEMTAPE